MGRFTAGVLAATVLAACSRSDPPKKYTPLLASSLPAPVRASAGATVADCAECADGTRCLEEVREGAPRRVCARVATAAQIAAPPGGPHATVDEFLDVPVVVTGTRWKRGGVEQTLMLCVAKPGGEPDNCCNSCRASIGLEGLPGVEILSPSAGTPGCGAGCCDPLVCSPWVPAESALVDVAGRFERLRPSFAEGTVFRLMETVAETEARRPVSAEKFRASSSRWERAVERVVRFLPSPGKRFPASGCASAELPEGLDYDPALKVTTEPCAARSADGRTAVDMAVSRNPLGTQYGYVFGAHMDAEEAIALLDRCGCRRWRHPFPVAMNWWAAELVFPR